MSRINERTTENLIATIAGKEYVDRSTYWEERWGSFDTISCHSYNNGVCSDYRGRDSQNKTCYAYSTSNALLKVIETVDKRVNDVYELVISLEKKLQQHQRDDFLTQHLVERQKLFNELQGQHAELEQQHARLKAEHEKLQEEKKKLDEWKAKLQKQFE